MTQAPLEEEEFDTNTLPPLPSKMHAIVQTAFGNEREVLEMKTMTLPKPTKYQILVKVHSVALNPVDWKITNGNLESLIGTKHPCIIGRDFAGEIVEIGSNANTKYGTKFKLGDRVAGLLMPTDYRHGSFAEYIIVNPANIVIVPSNVSFNQACCLPLVGQTSYQSIIEKGELKIGQKLLILGGSTATGMIAIQLAAAANASEIIVTSSQEALCKSLGATRVINYKTEDWVKELKGYGFDLVYDCVGSQKYWEDSITVLKPNGKYVTIVGDVTDEKWSYGKVVGQGLSIVNRKFWSLFNSPDYIQLMKLHPNNGLKEIFQLVKNGKLKAIIDENGPFKMGLNEAIRMYEISKSHKAHGKIVMEIVPTGNSKSVSDIKPNETETETETKEDINENENESENKTNQNENENSNNIVSEEKESETKTTNQSEETETTETTEPTETTEKPKSENEES